MKNLIHSVYSKPLPKALKLKAQREHAIVKSIQKILRQRPDIVIRRTDKSKVFYIGKASDLERKAEEYMMKTKAYDDVTNFGCPLIDNVNAVEKLLNTFLQKGVLTKQQHKRLIVKPEKLELAHFHTLPKPHKVS